MTTEVLSIGRALLEPNTPAGRAHDTLLSALERAAQTDAALHFEKRGADERVSFAAVLADAHRWSDTLREHGLERGDRVPILLPTSAHFVAAFFGTLAAGGVPVPLATPMTFGSVDRYLANLERVLDDADAKLLVTYPRIRDALASVEPPARTRAVLTENDLGGRHPFRSEVSLDAGDPAFIQYTSGTTGDPKGVVISHRAALSNVFAIADALGLQADDTGVSWLPLYHDMGLVGVLLTAVAHPFDVHLLSPEAFVMQPARWLGVASRARATLTVAPNFAFDLCVARAHPGDDARLDSLRVVLNGSEPVQPTTTRRFETHYRTAGFSPRAMVPAYGMAENTLAVSFGPRGEGVRTVRVDRECMERSARVVPSSSANALEIVSLGRPVAGTRVCIRSDADTLATDDTLGDVWISGASQMEGYFRRDAINAERIRDGWYRTGDLGFVHDGALYVVGRGDEVILKGGRNVYPHDVERIAGTVRGVRSGSLAAFGRNNTESGTQDVVLVVETREHDTGERERIAREIRGEVLAVMGVKVDAVQFVPPGAIPRTTSGKARRRACARVFEAGGTAT